MRDDTYHPSLETLRRKAEGAAQKLEVRIAALNEQYACLYVGFVRQSDDLESRVLGLGVWPNKKRGAVNVKEPRTFHEVSFAISDEGGDSVEISHRSDNRAFFKVHLRAGQQITLTSVTALYLIAVFKTKTDAEAWVTKRKERI